MRPLGPESVGPWRNMPKPDRRGLADGGNERLAQIPFGWAGGPSPRNDAAPAPDPRPSTRPATWRPPGPSPPQTPCHGLTELRLRRRLALTSVS
jgi:hypothetical protein